MADATSATIARAASSATLTPGAKWLIAETFAAARRTRTDAERPQLTIFSRDVFATNNALSDESCYSQLFCIANNCLTHCCLDGSLKAAPSCHKKGRLNRPVSRSQHRPGTIRSWSALARLVSIGRCRRCRRGSIVVSAQLAEESRIDGAYLDCIGRLVDKSPQIQGSRAILSGYRLPSPR